MIVPQLRRRSGKQHICTNMGSALLLRTFVGALPVLRLGRPSSGDMGVF